MPTDKIGNELADGDLVTLVYGGDPHSGQIIAFTNLGDVTHALIRTTITVPAASILLASRLERAKDRGVRVREQTRENDGVSVPGTEHATVRHPKTRQPE